MDTPISSVNVSDIWEYCNDAASHYSPYKLWLAIMAPATLVFGTIGNLLCIVTLRNERFRSTSTGFILSIMVIVDLGLLLVCLVEFWLLEVYDVLLRNLHSVACPLLNCVVYFLRLVVSFHDLPIDLRTVHRSLLSV